MIISIHNFYNLNESDNQIDSKVSKIGKNRGEALFLVLRRLKMRSLVNNGIPLVTMKVVFLEHGFP